MFRPPPLGVGMVYFPALEPFFEYGAGLLDVLEIEPQTLWTRSQGIHRLNEPVFSRLERWPQRKLVHGVGMPVATTVDFDPQQFAPWRESIRRLQSPWVSEHLAFMRVPGALPGSSSAHSGFLLPALQCSETVELAAAKLRVLRQVSGVPVAFENSPNYLRHQHGEMDDGEFYARVATKADCGILLDLHNLWCNEQNGRQTMREVMQCLPLERVWEIHLAGGDLYHGYWLDAHSDLVPMPVMELCEEWLPRLPNLGAIIFEIMPDYVHAKAMAYQDLAAQLETMRALWDRYRKPSAMTSAPANQICAAAVASEPLTRLPSVHLQHWEQALGSLVNGREVPPALKNVALASDPGVQVLKSLVESFRAGTVAEGLTLSYRLLVLTLGDEATSRLMAEFWIENWPQPYALDEMQTFAGFLVNRIVTGQLVVPHLQNVLAYELAYAQTLQTGNEQWVRFDCEPLALLSALSRGDVPQGLTVGCFDLHVTAESSDL